MKPRVQIDSIVFRRNEVEDSDGYVIYLITKPCQERPCTHVCETHPERSHHYERQLFRRGARAFRKNSTEEERKSNRANVWGWDGNIHAPTLTPSFLANRSSDEGLGYELHAFLKAGSIDLCGDSTVDLEASPIPCRVRDRGEGWEG